MSQLRQEDFKLSRASDGNDYSSTSRGARFIRRQSRHSRVKITLFKSEIIVTAGDTRLFVRFIFKPLYNGEKKNLQHASEHTLAWAVKQPPCLKWNRNKNVNKLRVWEQFRLMWPHRERYLVLESKAAVCLMSWEKLPQQFVCRHLAFWHANPLNLSLNLKLHFLGYLLETRDALNTSWPEPTWRCVIMY